MQPTDLEQAKVPLFTHMANSSTARAGTMVLYRLLNVLFLPGKRWTIISIHLSRRELTGTSRQPTPFDADL